MWGTQRYKNKLRALLVQELKCHMEWYKRIPSKVEGADTNWDETLQEAEKNNVYLGFAHVFALSNVLGRTIVVYANDTDYKHFGGSENGVTATIFPARKIAFNEVLHFPLSFLFISPSPFPLPSHPFFHFFIQIANYFEKMLAWMILCSLFSFSFSFFPFGSFLPLY